MLKSFFRSPKSPDAAFSFLNEFAPQALLSNWILVSGKKTKSTATFMPNSPHAYSWLRKHISDDGLFVMIGEAKSSINRRAPTDYDLKHTRHFAIEVPSENIKKIDGFRPKPFIIADNGGNQALMWRLINPTSVSKALELEERIAKKVGGKPLALKFPIPGSYAKGNLVTLRTLNKDRNATCLYTDFDSHEEVSPSEGIEYQSTDQITAKPIEWIWPQLIPRGKLTLLGGMPGLGKSQVTIWIAAAISRGSQWPCLADRAPIGDVLILASEDDAADTIKPRLIAAGAELSRVHITNSPINLAEDLEKLKQMVSKIGNVLMIVFDPISRYIAGTSPAKTRAAFDALNIWAAEQGIALLAIRHPPKGEAANAQNLFSGSAEEIRIARAAWMILPDPNAKGRGMLLFAKGNIISDKKGYSYDIKGVELDGEIETSCVVWSEKRIEMTADEYLESGSAPSNQELSDKEKKRDKINAAEWVRKALADGPMMANALKTLAESAGIKTPALYKVWGAGIVETVSVKGTKEKQWCLKSSCSAQ